MINPVHTANTQKINMLVETFQLDFALSVESSLESLYVGEADGTVKKLTISLETHIRNNSRLCSSFKILNGYRIAYDL